MTPEEAADGLDFLTDDSCSPLTLAAQGAVRVLIDHARATAEPEIGAEVVTGAEVAECDWCEDPATVALPDLADDEDARRPDRDPRACHKHDAEFGVGRSVPLAPEPAPPIAVGDTVTTAAELDRLPLRSDIERMQTWLDNLPDELESAALRSVLAAARRLFDLGEVTS